MHRNEFEFKCCLFKIGNCKIKVNEKDENAFVTINDVSDIMGGKHRKRAIH